MPLGDKEAGDKAQAAKPVEKQEDDANKGLNKPGKPANQDIPLGSKGEAKAGKEEHSSEASAMSQKDKPGQSAMAAQGEANKAATPDRADTRPGQTPPETKLAQNVHETQEAKHKQHAPGHDYKLDPMPKAVTQAVYAAAREAVIRSSEELPDRKFLIIAETPAGRTKYVVGRDGNIFSTELAEG